MRIASALRLFRRHTTGTHEPEPADMGTAFGMEASFGDASEYEDFRRSDYGLESQTTPPAAIESPLSWMTARRS
ncbi:hypothetical protein OU995_04420 [Roseateles sp. SL47]|jgi:hypothetical protein|uniref:hypothetical protein n=1 Tax=Roseateles sp. SL47 TaxID=2995138 RepID=UPI00226D9547|nr:hypothetical protein [Roseateles sp. SL47]WAC73984.1 hypothetical protein OU995_04420 [Roseateles sp. SL47]